MFHNLTITIYHTRNFAIWTFGIAYYKDFDKYLQSKIYCCYVKEFYYLLKKLFLENVIANAHFLKVTDMKGRA